MQVSIKYADPNALTIEEVVRQAQHVFGKHVKVEVTPDSTMPLDFIYFGIQNLATHRQLSMLYDKGSNYQAELAELRSDILFKLTEIVDQVLIDNESRV